jgi:tetratricopeptide (TPR) repeat protein
VAKLLYSATDASGKSKAGLIDAASAEEALVKLRNAGFRDIQLHDEPSIAAQRTDRLDLDEAEATRLAEFELRVRKSQGLGTVLAEVARRGWLWIAVLCAVAIWGLLAQQAVAVWVSALLLVLTFGIPAWSFRHASRYDRLQRSFALGEWERAETLIRMLRTTQLDTLQFDLDIREASIQAVRGGPAQALAAVEKWRARLAAGSPGLFEARLASVYHAAGDYKGFLEQMRKAQQALPDDPSRQLDLALAEARLGDAGVAQDLLERLNSAALPSQGRPFIHWTRGLIALRRNEKSAHAELARGVAGFLEHGTNPAFWSALALCGGAHALALARAGKADAARKALDRVSSILMVHGDKPLLRMIQLEVQPQGRAGA